MNQNKIEIKGVSKSFGKNTVLDNLNLTIKQGSSLVIIGGSGSGKSVLAKMIIGLITPDKGSIKIDGIETVNMRDKERFVLLAKCGFLFQNGGLFDSLSVQDNITFLAKRILKLSKKEEVDLATEKLYQVGLAKSVLDLFPSELSGGMRKRVGIARAISTDPDLIIFDEPTGGLDPIMTNLINNLIIQIGDKQNITTITITHNIASTYKIAQEVAFLYQGNILWSGKKEEMKCSKNSYLQQFIKGEITGPIKI